MRTGRSILLIFWVAAMLMVPACAPAPAAPGVVLVILDTVRADHLSCYGYDRPTSPNLDRLASEGELYREAYAQAPWTLPAVASILTGQPPHVHGAGRADRGLLPVHRDVPNLAERLSEAGVRTAAFVNVVFCGPRSGLDRGFHLYDFRTTDASNVGQRDARATTDAALEWLRSVGGEPFFVVVHYFDPHLTYDPPPPFESMFEPEEGRPLPRGFGSAQQVFELREGRRKLTPREKKSLVARYDGEIRFVDEQFGRLRAGLEEIGRWDDSLIVVVADHGEEFWDHGGFEHGHSHHREMVQVPLIVRRPGGPSGVTSEDRVRQLDIAPTILEFAGVEPSPELPGQALGRGAATYAVAEGSLWAGELVSVRADEGTLIWDRTSDRRRFYATQDRPETEDLWRAGLPESLELEKVLRALPLERREPGERWEPTPEEIERLRALGYVR